MKVLYMSDLEESTLQLLKKLVNEDIEILQIPAEEKNKVEKHIKEVDALIGARVDRELLKRAKQLDYYIIPFAGIPSQDKEVLREFPEITVINSHYNATFVAEHAWALLLASVKKLCPIHNQLKEGDWRPRYDEEWKGRTLREKTLLVLGYGHIGRKVAQMGNGFGMSVKAIKRKPQETSAIDFLGTTKDLHSVLPEADFIVCTLPATEATKDYLGKQEFELMKEGVHLVNVSRGSVINEDAFYEAVKSGKLGGAGLDAWWIYPSNEDDRTETFPSHHPLDEFDNIVFSPHRAWDVREHDEERMKDLAQILNQLAQGEIINKVKLEKGY